MRQGKRDEEGGRAPRLRQLRQLRHHQHRALEEKQGQTKRRLRAVKISPIQCLFYYR